MRGFYAFGFYLAVAHLPDLVNHGPPPLSLLLWPVAWLGWTRHTAAGVQIIVGLLLTGTGLAALFTESRAARLLAAFGWLEYVALENSSAKIGHSLHVLVLLAALLVALPRGWHLPAASLGRLGRQRTLGVFWACQAATLLTYSLSGLGKIGGSFYQLALGQTHVFSPHALAYHVADRLLQTASLTELGSWLIRFPWAGWPAMLATVYLQGFAFAVAFRPALQRWWAAGLIGFHLASFFTMTINFPQNCFLLALLFFRSPFAPAGPLPPILLPLAQLPLFGPLFRRLRPGAFPPSRAALG